jgi:hypothetical protein
MGFETDARTTTRYYTGAADSDGGIGEQRLAELLKVNAETARDKALYRTDRERTEASSMSSPIDSNKVFAYFGLTIGTLPPFALAFKIIGEGITDEPVAGLFLALLAAAGIATGSMGYALGRVVPSALSYAEQFRVPNRIAFLAMVGFAWGAVSGAVGGLLLFVIGSIFAALAGGLVGAVALPILAAFHSALRRGELIEMKHFLPIAFGITLTLCAFILGL